MWALVYPHTLETMKLIGMLDSPYVRRVAVSMQLLGLHFEHLSLSVFSTFDEFAQINPVVKAPSLVCDDGQVLMDSGLILDYAETLAAQKMRYRSLMPTGVLERQQALRVIGLALAVCEKSVQIVYERNLRPVEKLHEPWMSRVTGQLLAACNALELELGTNPPAITSSSVNQAGVTAAVAWHFTQKMLPEVVDEAAYPRLCQFSALAEEMAEFKAAPHGAGVYERH